MRILIVCPNLFPGDGVATYSFNLAKMLQVHGHDTAFFSMQDDKNIPDPNSDLFVGRINYAEINNRKTIKSAWQVVSRIFYSSEARKKFSAMLNRFKPDVIHIQGFRHFMSPSILFEANKRGIPIVHTLHDMKMICPNTSMINDRSSEICEACNPTRYYMPIIKRCKKGSLSASLIASIEAYFDRIINVRERIQAYISPSRFLMEKFRNFGFSSEHFYHIPNMLSEELIQESDIDEGYFLFIGRVDPLKGIRELVAAARKTPSINLKIAGRIAPSMQDEFPACLPENIEYMGLRSGQELRDLTTHARAVVVPSTWYENQPFSILEAFAAGKPVIATDLGGMTELVSADRGILVRKGNVDDITNAMRWINEHPDEAKIMGTNAREYVKDQHGAKSHYEKIMDVYNQVINENSLRSAR